MTIKTVGVVGSGTMGAGIAIVAARAGFTTRVLDARPEALDAARGQTEAFLAKSVARGKMPAERLPEIMASWHGTTQAEDLADCDVVIEAIYEDLSAKQALFKSLDAICPPHTL